MDSLVELIASVVLMMSVCFTLKMVFYQFRKERSKFFDLPPWSKKYIAFYIIGLLTIGIALSSLPLGFSAIAFGLIVAIFQEVPFFAKV